VRHAERITTLDNFGSKCGSLIENPRKTLIFSVDAYLWTLIGITNLPDV